jgi:hypothetical protein
VYNSVKSINDKRIGISVLVGALTQRLWGGHWDAAEPVVKPTT